METPSETVLITGCGSGFGAGLAARLLAAGHRVIATDPDPDALELLQGDCLKLALDVRDAAAIERVVATANRWSPVDVLVNNGGYAVFGTQEETDLELVQDMFDVNVFGPARMTRALLPTLRDRAGTVVQLSSMAGRTVFPESGWYAATKHALEAMTEALAQEVVSFGVRIRLVEPGSFATRFLETAAAASPDRDPASPYAALRAIWDARKIGVLEPPQDPALVVDAILASLQRPTVFERVVVGADAERVLGLREALGPDAFSLLNQHRNAPPGFAGFTAGRPGHVLSPLEALEQLEAGLDTEALRATRAAWRAGHLDHWRDSEHGLAALQALAAVG
jgi:NAD(P)-dependent dehydrogenase (short-subunit alcohol dehydrogenase family)